jgi:MFS family permease
MALFNSKKLRVYILILPFIWFSTAFAFFAINFEVKYFRNDIFVSNFIIFSSEAFSYFVSNKMMDIFGKKISMILGFLVSALSYLLFLFIDKENAILTLLLIFLSKYGASSLLNISSIYTNEVFPTDVRGRAIGICSFFGKFGGIIAPIMVETSEYTLVISGIICIISCVVLIPLNNNSSLSQLIDKIEDLDENLINSEL